MSDKTSLTSNILLSSRLTKCKYKSVLYLLRNEKKIGN